MYNRSIIPRKFISNISSRPAFLTLELSLLMPGIIAIIIIVIYSGYYFHDRCVLQRGAYAAVLKSSYESSYDEAMIIQIFNKEIDARLIGNWNLNEDVTKYADETSINIYGEMDIISGVLTRYLSKAIYSVDITESTLSVKESEYIKSRKKMLNR